jgi:membrane protein YdbS with pleckstrin-like domain
VTVVPASILFNIGTPGVLPWFLWGIVLFIPTIILIEYFYERWYFETYFYDLTPEFVQIKKGVITSREITVPYERIQDVYVDQDICDRIFGLYDVHISSATFASGALAHIDGVEKQAADGLRSFLLETVKQKIGKNPIGNTKI